MSEETPETPTENLTPENFEAENLALQAEATKWKDLALRAQADYQNLQKRVQRDAELERERNKARVLEDFLRVYEYVGFARKDAEANSPHLGQGVLMVAKEFDRLLENQGVQPVGAIGDDFDATLHEAVAQEWVEGVDAGKISRVVTVGYKLGERVLRYAKVTTQPNEPVTPS